MSGAMGYGTTVCSAGTQDRQPKVDGRMGGQRRGVDKRMGSHVGEKEGWAMDFAAQRSIAAISLGPRKRTHK